MKKTVSIVGARPQFIKAFITIKSLNKIKNVKNLLIHIGQHFDKSMSQIFLNELMFYKIIIKINLKNKNQRLLKISEMISEIYLKLKKINPNSEIVYGDTDTTLAASIVSKRLNIKTMHIESGLRSNVIEMPEEQNRYIADYLSDYLIAPTINAYKNINEFKETKNIYNYGDVMYDSVKYYKKIVKQNSTKFKKKYKLKDYIFFSVHRDANTDVKKIKFIINQISKINCTFFWPIHPKIKNIIINNNLSLPSNVISSSPISYLESIAAINLSKFIVTDSGGIQKESYFMKKKCFVLRKETEWKELIKLNSVKLIDLNLLIIEKSKKFLNSKIKKSSIYGDGNATEKIASLVKKII